MKNNTLLIVGVIVVIVVFAFVIFGCKKRDGYENVNSPYLMNYGRFLIDKNVGEYNANCMRNAAAHCMMSDGREGECVNNGICMPNMLSVQYGRQCVLPTSKANCPIFCKCKTIEKNGNIVDMKDCMTQCEMEFNPLFI
jgi:hypothetical protein